MLVIIHVVALPLTHERVLLRSSKVTLLISRQSHLRGKKKRENKRLVIAAEHLENPSSSVIILLKCDYQIISCCSTLHSQDDWQASQNFRYSIIGLMGIHP